MASWGSEPGSRKVATTKNGRRELRDLRLQDSLENALEKTIESRHRGTRRHREQEMYEFLELEQSERDDLTHARVGVHKRF